MLTLEVSNTKSCICRLHNLLECCEHEQKCGIGFRTLNLPFCQTDISKEQIGWLWGSYQLNYRLYVSVMSIAIYFIHPLTTILFISWRFMQSSNMRHPKKKYTDNSKYSYFCSLFYNKKWSRITQVKFRKWNLPFWKIENFGACKMLYEEILHGIMNYQLSLRRLTSRCPR